MTSLKETLKKNSARKLPHTPVLFYLAQEKDRIALETLLRKEPHLIVVDDYKEQERELFAIYNPSQVFAKDFETQFETHYADQERKTPAWQRGAWVYYPWRTLLSHVLSEDEYFTVRTARNRNLITLEEQKKFYEASIGIAGLSVGSSVAFAIALGGGGKHMKLADMDKLALSNTNRVLAGADRLGVLKVEMAARTIYEINPYAKLELYSEGITEKTIDSFFSRLSIVIDEIDNLAAKFLIREQAKKHHIPVVMAADNGDNAVVDIERYDLAPQPLFFQGRMGKVSFEMLKKLDKFGIGKMITKHVGLENVTLRMQESLLEMGKTIVSWPQLGGAALINGSAVAYCVRRILNNQDLENNRALISLDEKFIPGYFSEKEKGERAKAAEVFRTIFGL